MSWWILETFPFFFTKDGRLSTRKKRSLIKNKKKFRNLNRLFFNDWHQQVMKKNSNMKWRAHIWKSLVKNSKKSFWSLPHSNKEEKRKKCGGMPKEFVRVDFLNGNLSLKKILFFQIDSRWKTDSWRVRDTPSTLRIFFYRWEHKKNKTILFFCGHKILFRNQRKQDLPTLYSTRGDIFSF